MILTCGKIHLTEGVLIGVAGPTGTPRGHDAWCQTLFQVPDLKIIILTWWCHHDVMVRHDDVTVTFGLWAFHMIVHHSECIWGARDPIPHSSPLNTPLDALSSNLATSEHIQLSDICKVLLNTIATRSLCSWMEVAKQNFIFSLPRKIIFPLPHFQNKHCPGMCYSKWLTLYYISGSFLNNFQPCWRSVKQKATNNSRIPLKLRRFLPEVNMARNSNLGLHFNLAQGTNNACSANGNYLISSKCRSRESWADAQTINITTFFGRNWTIEGWWDCDVQCRPEEQTEGVKIGI